MIARPARVCIRLRKPCLRARFLVFGWYVRFIEALLSATLASSGGGAPGVPSISWVRADPFAPDRSRRCSSATVFCDGGVDVAVDPGFLPSPPWFGRRRMEPGPQATADAGDAPTVGDDRLDG